MDFSIEKLNHIISLSNNEALLQRVEVASFYSFLFKETNICVSCDGKIIYYLNQLKTHGKQLLNNRQMVKICNFKLRAELGSLQMDFGSSKWFNNDTLTDELAIEYLKINPNRIDNFEFYPENWEELLTGKSPENIFSHESNSHESNSDEGNSDESKSKKRTKNK